MYVNMQKTKKNKQTNKINTTNVALIGTIFTLVGGFFLSYNYIENKKIIAFDEMSNSIYKEQVKSESEKKEESPVKKEPIDEPVVEKLDNNIPKEPQQVNNGYIGYLDIPKINLKKGFLSKNDPNNNIEKNIAILPESSFPDVANGNFIITGHSGSGWKAFFDELEHLVIGDKAHVDYNGKRYTYNIVNIYKETKDGNIAIYRNYDKTTLTLITCTNDSDLTQTIYIAELESIA